jgi:hypothetical protein
MAFTPPFPCHVPSPTGTDPSPQDYPVLLFSDFVEEKRKKKERNDIFAF